MKSLLTASVIMSGVMLFSFYGLRGFWPVEAPFLHLMALPLSTAAGAALAVRLRGSGWPTLVWSAILSSAVLLAAIGFTVPGATPSPGDYPAAILVQGQSLLIFLGISSSGIFFLPLVDPVARRSGPAPSRKELAMVTLIVAILLVAADLAQGPAVGSEFGLGVLVMGVFGGFFLMGAGLVVSLGRAWAQGAWAGGLGIMLTVASILIWLFTGMKWIS